MKFLFRPVDKMHQELVVKLKRWSTTLPLIITINLHMSDPIWVQNIEKENKSSLHKFKITQDHPSIQGLENHSTILIVDQETYLNDMMDRRTQSIVVRK